MATKKRKPAKRAPREDFNQAAHRIVQSVIEKTEKPAKSPTKPGRD
jgi:hypothetical protein